jgi:type I restriction enzyme R subunit
VIDLHLAEDVLAHLVRVQPSIEGNLQAWEFLKGLRTELRE